jgi:hypothetical protein
MQADGTPRYGDKMPGDLYLGFGLTSERDSKTGKKTGGIARRTPKDRITVASVWQAMEREGTPTQNGSAKPRASW